MSTAFKHISLIVKDGKLNRFKYLGQVDPGLKIISDELELNSNGVSQTNSAHFILLTKESLVKD